MMMSSQYGGTWYSDTDGERWYDVYVGTIRCMMYASTMDTITVSLRWLTEDYVVPIDVKSRLM